MDEGSLLTDVDLRVDKEIIYLKFIIIIKIMKFYHKLHMLKVFTRLTSA